MSCVKDIPYADAPGLTLDLYLPDGPARAVVLYVHGGGFYFGDKADAFVARFVDRLAPLGFAVLSMNHRLGAAETDFAEEECAVIRAGAARSKRIGLTIEAGMTGAAYMATVEDLSRAVAAIRSGAVLPDLVGLPVGILGNSAGGIAALGLAAPPQLWSDRLEQPDAVLGVCAAVVQPWRLSEKMAPSWIVYGTADRHVGPENVHLAARRAEAVGAPLTLLPSGIAGHKKQIFAAQDQMGSDDRPLIAPFTDYLLDLSTV